MKEVFVMTMCFTVEPLPTHPSLEHQQKLAKRLLRAVSAGDAEAIRARQVGMSPIGHNCGRYDARIHWIKADIGG